MATKRIKCRTHGGYFTVEARRGRPPVKCTEDNKCDAQTLATPTKVRDKRAQEMLRRGDVQGAEREYIAQRRDEIEKLSAPQTRSKTRTLAASSASSSASETFPRNASWVENKAATTKKINELFRQVTVLGWNAKRAWIDDTHAEITAARGEEMLWIVVKAGMVIEQQYSLWSFDKPSLNRKPVTKLPFDPDEIGDRELAQYLVGAKVTWYNRLSGKEETAYCGRDNIRIEHGYNSLGDEVPGERIIKFVDADGMGFRAFRLDALLKVGK